MPQTRTPAVRALLVILAVVVAVLVLRALAMTQAEAEGTPPVSPMPTEPVTTTVAPPAG